MYLCMYLCIYVCIYVSMYLCMYISMYLCMYLCIYVCIYVSMYLCMCISMYLCMYLCIYVCIYVSMYLCMYISMYLCMYLCIYVRTYVRAWVRTYVGRCTCIWEPLTHISLFIIAVPHAVPPAPWALPPRTLASQPAGVHGATANPHVEGLALVQGMSVQHLTITIAMDSNWTTERTGPTLNVFGLIFLDLSGAPQTLQVAPRRSFRCFCLFGSFQFSQLFLTLLAMHWRRSWWKLMNYEQLSLRYIDSTIY